MSLMNTNHRPRIMPALLIKHDGLLYKTQKFKNPKYVGDPRIAVKIFNDKCADELILLDIDSSVKNYEPKYDLIHEIAGEAFMPVAYGGGIKSFQQAKKIFSLGIEKIIINSGFFNDSHLIQQISEYAGSQSVVVSIDIKQNWNKKYNCYIKNGKYKVNMSPIKAIELAERMGAGEIFINNIDRDGTFLGYEKNYLNDLAKSTTLPLIACGGATNIENCVELLKETEVSAAAAGSIFVFQGPHRAVLIKFPTNEDLNKLFI